MRPAVAERMARSLSTIIGSSSFTNRKLSQRSQSASARTGPMVGPPGLKSWIRTGNGVEDAIAAQYSTMSASDDANCLGMAKETTSAPISV